MTQKFYEQQLDASATGFFSNIGGQVGADQFTFSEDVTITGINWYGFYGSDLNTSITSIDFQLSFYLDNSGVPTSNPISEQIFSAQVQDTGLQEQGQFGSSIYEFQTDLISPLEIAAGETTWIAIAENDTLTPAFGNTQWLWSFSLPGTESTKAFRNTNPNLASDWEITNGQLAFALTGETSGSVTNGEEEATMTTVTKLTDGGQGSLRQAIIDANASPKNDIIELAEGTYSLTLSGSDEDAGATGDLDIINNGTLTIIGLGNGATIEATGLGDRVFQVFSGAILNLEKIIVTGGAAETNDGGGIYNGGSLTLTQTTISNNSALNGGGIYNQGLATLINSNLSNNFTAVVPGVGRGGGGGILNSGGRLTLINSSISGGSATNGGGIVNTNSSNATIINSTVSSNSAALDGGGIANIDSTLTINNSTIYGNSAGEDGGGIFTGNLNLNSTVNLSNTIIANNEGGDVINGDNFRTQGTINTTGVNLVEDGSLTGANILNLDPLLGSLQNNGGSNLSHAPLSGSPVIDAGDNSLIALDSEDLDGDNNTSEPIPFDQRGVGFERIINVSVDIGAVEANTSNGENINVGDDGGTFDFSERTNNLNITGGNGDDEIISGSGDDNISSGGGDDIIDPGAGNNTIDAGAGDDVIVGSGQADIDNQIDGGAGNDTVIYDGIFESFPVSRLTTNTVKVGNNTDILTNVEKLQFTNRTVAVEDLEVEPALDDPLFRFRNENRSGTYLFAGEQEAEGIRENFIPPFVEEGEAFKVSLDQKDDLVQFNRFQSIFLPGTYIFANEEESQGIRENFSDAFREEGVAFYAYGADDSRGEDVIRFRNRNNNTYLFALSEEAQSIEQNFSDTFVREGVAFEVAV